MQCMQELGHSCDAYPDLWMKAEYRLGDKLEHYSYIVYYMDGILCLHHNPDDVLIKLKRYVTLKSGSVWSPDMYLGTILMCMQLYNGI